jgi:hypothetical protein
MAISGTITLADVAERTDTLTVACTRCERSGRYPVVLLVKRHGRRCGVPELLQRLSADCPRRASVKTYDLCGVHCPELAGLFLNRLPS